MDAMTTDNGTTAPAIMDTDATVEVKTKRTRKTPDATQIAEMKRLRAEKVTFSEVARQTGFSVGTVQKYSEDGAAPKPKGAKRGPKPKAAKTAAPASSGRLDTVTAVRLAMADLLFAGHAVAEIRGALASLNLAH